MESVLASWSSPTINGLVLDDSVSSASLSQISPSSPTTSVRSPTLYDYGSSNGDGILPKGPKVGSRKSQLAESLLRDIEFGRDSQYPQADLLNEDFVNLELFQDLDNAFTFVDTPPLSPEISNANDKFYESPASSPLILEEEFPEETFHQLNAEFQQILDSFPEASFNVDEEAMELIENIIDIREMEENGDDSQSVSSGSEDEDASQHEGEGQGQMIEVEYFITGDIPSLNQSPEPAEDEDDIQAEVSVKILDALLDGNLEVANSYLPPNASHVEVIYEPMQVVTLVPVSNSTEIEGNPTTSTKSTSKKKVPKTNQKKPRLPPRVDRVQRKKEQNKTAATRYREKKKILASLITQEEEVLSSENSKLLEQKNDLSKQISIVKQLLRDVMNAKKEKKFGISPR